MTPTLRLRPSVRNLDPLAPPRPRQPASGYRLARSSSRPDEAHAELVDLARRIHRLRGQAGLDVVAVRISRPEVAAGFIPAVQGSGTSVERAAVAVHRLGPDGERGSLLGYAFHADPAAAPLTPERLREALLRLAPEPLRHAPDLETEAA